MASGETNTESDSSMNPFSFARTESSTADNQPEVEDRDYFGKALNQLSEVVATEGCKFALRHQMASASLLLQENDQLKLYAYLTNKQDTAKKDLKFASKQLLILRSTAIDNVVEALREYVQRTFVAQLQTSSIATVSHWILEDSSINTRSLELRSILEYLQHDAETVLQFVKDEAVSQCLEEVGTDSADDDGISENVFETLRDDARDNMLVLFGVCFHTKRILQKIVRTYKENVLFSVSQNNGLAVVASDEAILAKASDEVRNSFEAFKVSSYQSNCLFQALSLCLTDFRDESYDYELRARTLWQLIDSWHKYSAEHYSEDDAAQTEALENLLWSLRRFNAFSCRLMHAIPQVVNKDIDVIIVSENATLKRSLTSEVAANACKEKLYLATFDLEVERKDRNNRLFHVGPLKLRPNVNADSLTLPEADENASLFGAYSRFGGLGGNNEGEGPSGESVPKVKLPVRSKFDWQLYRRMLEHAETSLSAGQPDLLMSIYGSNTKVMKSQFARLQALCENNVELDSFLQLTCKHLKQEFERLDRLQISFDSADLDLTMVIQQSEDCANTVSDDPVQSVEGQDALQSQFDAPKLGLSKHAKDFRELAAAASQLCASDPSTDATEVLKYKTSRVLRAAVQELTDCVNKKSASVHEKSLYGELSHETQSAPLSSGYFQVDVRRLPRSLSDWLYENDKVYKDLFDLKRQGWQNRSHDTRNYSIDSRGKDLEALYQCTLEGIERNPDVFYPSANKRFLDIGGAPDVTGKYLVENLQWSGFAVSMPTHWGGRNMEFKNNLKCELNIGAADAYDRLSNWLDQRGATLFDFVNMGVITPYKGDNPVRQEDRAMFGVRTQNNGQALHAVYRNSMCVALERLKEGGSVKWTLRESNLAELFRMLDILAKLFDEVRYVPCGRRAPFDLLCVGFRREKAQPVLEVIKRQSVPLNEHDNSFWMCEHEEAAGIYEKHKALLHVIWTERKEILAVALT